MIVYGSTQRKVPDSSMPPSQPYSSPTARRNSSFAKTCRLWSHRIGIGSDLIVQRETSDTSGGTTSETICIADLKAKVAAPDKVCAKMSLPRHLVPAGRRE